MQFPVETGRKLNIHKTFRTRPGRSTRIPGLWTLDAGLWTLDPGLWTLDTIDAGLWTQFLIFLD